MDETLLPSLGWLREFGVVSPVIQGEMAVVAESTGSTGSTGSRRFCRLEQGDRPLKLFACSASTSFAISRFGITS